MRTSFAFSSPSNSSTASRYFGLLSMVTAPLSFLTEMFQVVVLSAVVMNTAITKPDEGCQILLELLHLWVRTKTMHVIHVHFHPKLSLWVPEKPRCAHAPRESQLVHSCRREVINPTLTSLSATRQLLLELPTKGWCTCQLLAIDSSTLQAVQPPRHQARELDEKHQSNPE